MIKQHYSGSARRSVNIIWNAAQSYGFDPPFLAFFANGQPDDYLNMIIGLTVKWLDFERITDFFLRLGQGASLDEASGVLDRDNAAVESVRKQVGDAGSHLLAHIGAPLFGHLVAEIEDAVFLHADKVLLLDVLCDVEHTVGKLIGDATIIVFFGIDFTLSTLFLGNGPLFHGEGAGCQQSCRQDGQYKLVKV